MQKQTALSSSLSNIRKEHNLVFQRNVSIVAWIEKNHNLCYNVTTYDLNPVKVIFAGFLHTD